MFRWLQPCKDVTNDGAESIDSNLSGAVFHCEGCALADTHILTLYTYKHGWEEAQGR